MGRKDKHGIRLGDSKKYEKRTVKKGTDQFVVLGGELNEPLVKLKNCYNGHHIPEEERKGHNCN